jgi:tetratricopeptide (TPR) repeat protein
LGLLFHLAALRNLQRDYDGAEALYGQILERDSKNWVVMNNLAWLLALHKHDLAEALVQINHAMDRAGPLAELRDTRALVYLALGAPEKARLDLEAAIDDAPTPVMYFHLAQAEQMMRSLGAARASFEKAHNLGLRQISLHPLEQETYQRLRDELEVTEARN